MYALVGMLAKRLEIDGRWKMVLAVFMGRSRCM
jgi:hypothetical protein